MNAPSITEPNQYELAGGGLHITFQTFVQGPLRPGEPAAPTFVYQDAHRALTFHGRDVEVVDTELGTVASVAIHDTPDAGSTTFSLLLPRVNLADRTPASIHTEGVTTLHRSSIAPGLLHGQLDAYTVTKLHGTAAAVVVAF